jgi:hypothetical protein
VDGVIALLWPLAVIYILVRMFVGVMNKETNLPMAFFEAVGSLFRLAFRIVFAIVRFVVPPLARGGWKLGTAAGRQVSKATRASAYRTASRSQRRQRRRAGSSRKRRSGRPDPDGPPDPDNPPDDGLEDLWGRS